MVAFMLDEAIMLQRQITESLRMVRIRLHEEGIAEAVNKDVSFNNLARMTQTRAYERRQRRMAHNS